LVYEFNILTNKITPLSRFNKNTVGYVGVGELLEASNGKFYGISSASSETNWEARVFEFIPTVDSVIITSYLAGASEGNLIEVISNNSVSLDEKKSFDKLRIYPNPANSILNIDTKGEKILSVRVFTISGQLKEFELNTNNTLDVSNYKKGMYILQVETVNGTAISRFIKQ